MMYLKLERVKDSLVTFRVTFDQDQILAECKRQEAIKVSTKLKMSDCNTQYKIFNRTFTVVSIFINIKILQ